MCVYEWQKLWGFSWESLAQTFTVHQTLGPTGLEVNACPYESQCPHKESSNWCQAQNLSPLLPAASPGGRWVYGVEGILGSEGRFQHCQLPALATSCFPWGTLSCPLLWKEVRIATLPFMRNWYMKVILNLVHVANNLWALYPLPSLSPELSQWLSREEPACHARDVVGVRDLIPGLGRTPGEGNRNPLQYSYLENPLDRGAWQTTVHGIAKELDTT